MTNETEPQGCLAAILRLFGIKMEGAIPSSQQGLPFRLRDDFLSPAELSFFKVLQLATKDQVVISAKVNLADIFYVSRPNENRGAKNKIDRKHVDFLLCDPATMKPRCGVELDDSSHGRRDRQERDVLVDQVFQVAGLPLVRFPARASYDPKAIASELAPHLEARSDVTPRMAFASQSSGAPVCPKCDVPMVERTASKGQNAGKQFWGCPNYPSCRQVV